MYPDEIIFHQIDDYLRDRLSPAERAAFESTLADDEALAALVRRQEQENQALEVLAERDLRVRMNAWERAVQAPATLKPSGGRYRQDWMRWAVAAMLVIAAGWWMIQRVTPVAEAPVVVQPDGPVTPPTTVPKTTPTPRTTPAPGRPDRRSGTRPPKEVIADAPVPTPTPSAPARRPTDYAALADEFYRERDFVQNRNGSGITKSLVVKELLGHSLLKSRKYDAAITAFQEVSRSGQQPYADRAEWALALAYLHQMPRRSGALNQVLRNITARPGHPFYTRAKVLQGRLGEQ